MSMSTVNNNSNSAGGKAHGAHGASFEDNFTRLQEVVARLSDGNLTLEEALSAYEEGMTLADRCARMLDEAELRVKQVSERAMKAGAASLSELSQPLAQSNGQEIHGLVAIEIESYESTLDFGDVTSSKQSTARQAPPSPTPIKPRANQRPSAQPLLDELDPLFDDED
jgi:exodeoxyribonuclease VII small subunit